MGRRKVVVAALVLIGMAVAVTGCLYTGWFRSWLGSQLSARASRALDRRVEARVDRFRPHALALGLSDLRVAGAGPQDGPLLVVGRVDAAGSWAKLLRGRVEIDRLRISGARLDLNAPAGSEPDDTDAGAAWALGPVPIAELEITDSSLRFGGADMPMALLADGLELSARWRREEAGYRGDARAAAGSVDWPAIGALPISVSLDFALSEAALQVSGATLSGPGIEIAGGGSYRPALATSLEADLAWRASLADLPLTPLVEAGARGAAAGTAWVRGTGAATTAGLRIEAPELWIGPVPMESTSAALEFDGERLRLADLRSRVAGLDLRGGGTLRVVDSVLEAEATLQGDDLAPLLALAGLEKPRLGGALSGRLSLGGVATDWRALSGGFGIELTGLHALSRPSRRLQITARGGLDDGVIAAESVELTGPGVSLRGAGRWQPAVLSEARGGASFSNWADAEWLLRELGVEPDPLWKGRLDEVDGTLAADFQLAVPLDGGPDPERPAGSLDLRRSTGSIEIRSEGLAWKGRPGYRTAGSADLIVDRGEPVLVRGDLRAPGVRAAVRGPGEASDGVYRVDLEAPDIAPTAALASALMDRPEVDPTGPGDLRWQAIVGRLRGGLSLDATLSGWRPEARLEELAGSMEAVARDIGLDGSEGDLLAATLSATLAGGQLNVGRLRATLVGLEVEGGGRLDRHAAHDVGIRLTGASLAASLERSVPMLLELGVDAGLLDRLEGLSGGVEAEVRASGPWRAPRASGTLTVGGLAVGGRGLGDLEAEAESDGERLRYAADLGPAGGRVAIDGEVELSGERRGSLRGRVDRQQLAPLAELAGLGGRLAGEVEARVELSWPAGSHSGRVQLDRATVAGVAVERFDAEWNGGTDLLEITRGELRAAGGELSFGGRLGTAGRSEIEFAGDGLQLAHLGVAAGLPVDLEGSLGLHGRVSGTPEEPRLEAAVATRGMRLLQRPTPDLAGPMSLDRSGLTIALASADAGASLSWRMGFADGEPWTGSLEYPIHVALDRWLSGDAAGKVSVVEGVLRGDLQMPGGQPELMVGGLRLDDARLTAADYPLRLEGNPEVVLDPEIARLLPFRVRGEGTELTVAAELVREPTPSLRLEADGRLDLRVLQALSPGLTASGTATLDLEAGGPWPDFDWAGTARLQDGAVRHIDLPAALDRLAASVSLGPDSWTLDELRGRLGGGSLSARGRLGMAGFEPGDFRFEIDGVGVKLDYPEGFRSQFDAKLAVDRSGREAVRLSGQVALVRGLYDKDLGIERSILARRRALETAAEIERDWTDALDLELNLRAAEGLWVRNDLASLETRGELRVQGTLGRPRVSGRIEALEGGRIFFREVSYYVTQGSFDWVGGSIEDPRISVRAETSVGEYDVTLTVSGRLSEPTFELTSRPSLPTTDIVALLVAGATRDQLATGEGGLSQAQAAAYLSSGLTSRLEASLRKSLGLDEIKLDPVLVEGQTNPTARVTVGKTISPRLTATYSTRLGTAQKDVYQARYRLGESVELVGTRDDDGSLSADLRYNARQRQPAASAPAGSSGTPRAVVREILIRGGAIAGDDRLRRLLGLRIGEELRKARVLDGMERIRAWYLERRHPEVDTEYRIVETEGGVRLEIRVDEGPEVRFRFVGFEPAKRLERPLLELWQRSLFRDEIMRDVAARAVDILARDGYLSARAEGDLGRPAADRVEAVVTIAPGPRVRVEELAILGSESLEEKRVREQILTRPSGWRASWIDPALVAEDAQAIRALYLSSGFLAATVSPEIERRPPGNRASITYVIQEGPRFALRSVQFSGNSQVPTADLAGLTSQAVGQPYRDEATRALQRAVESLYDERGFPDARIEIVATPEPGAQAVDLVVSIHEGEKRWVETVEIVNPGITRESVVRREIELAPGDPLRRSALDSSQYRLYRTGLFRSVRLERLPGESEGAEHLRVALEEARNLRIHYGVGFDSEEGPRVTANVAHNNLDGGRLHLGVGGRWSPVDQRLQLLLRNPSMGGARAVGLMSAFWEAEERENFNATRVGFSLDLGRRYREGRVSVNIGYDVTELDEEQTAAPGATLLSSRTTRLAGARLGVARTTRDSSFWPTTGSHARAEATLFHSALGSEAEFGRLFAQWNRYRPLDGGWLWSFGVRAGVAQSLGSSAEIPFSERFFAGGETSLRGFARDSVIARGTPPELLAGVLPGQSLGGDVLLVLNQELMTPLWESVYGLVFYDAGNLYWRPGDLDPTRLRHSAGLGLRVQSPFGPIRLEYGWKLDRREAESAGQGHFSLGLAF